MATIKEVAEEAGLAVGTVSRVLNNRGYISEKAKKKVYDAMEKLNYQPNELARSLQNKTTSIIGVIVPHIIHPFFSEMINYIEEAAYKAGYRIILCNSQSLDEKEESYVNILKANRVAGIIMFTGGSSLKAFEALGTPVIAIECFPEFATTIIECDNEMGGILAAETLADKGCRCVAIVSNTPPGPMPSYKRTEAFIRVCEEMGMEVYSIMTSEASFDNISYVQEMEAHIAKDPEGFAKIDGIFATGDMIAAQILRVCQNHKKRVPEDVKVIGYDDVLMASYFTPPLTTVHQPIKEMAFLAVDLMNKALNGEKLNDRYTMPVHMVTRESC
ncbi:MAG: LacI family transcriptional regulator [Dorea sp.]|nr:LacI family transcriptional regulator [Dorea sp.]